MAIPPFDRTLLGPHGQELSDDDYAQIVAALGLWRFTVPPSGEPEWSATAYHMNLGLPPGAAGVQQLHVYRARWDELRNSLTRLILDANASDWGKAFDQANVLAILNHPATGVRASIRMRCRDADLRWRWPIRVSAFPDDFASMELARIPSLWPSQTLVTTEAISREHARCDVLIARANIRELVRRLLTSPYAIRAAHVMLIDSSVTVWGDVLPYVSGLMKETQAAGLSIISLRRMQPVPEAINDWVRELSHNVAFDLALVQSFGPQISLHALDPLLIDAAALPSAARQLGTRLQELPAHAIFVIPPNTPGRIDAKWTHADPPGALGAELIARATTLPYDFESTGATAIAEISTAEREARRSVAHRESPRYLQGDMFRVSGREEYLETAGLVVGERYALDVKIDEAGRSTVVASSPVPLDSLDWTTTDSHALQVMFAEPDQWDEPQLGTLTLSRTGASSTWRFSFSPVREGAFSGRITLYYHGRVLQTALWETRVLSTLGELEKTRAREPMRLRPEVVVRRSMTTLDDRRRFDACVVLNHTATHKAAMTAAGKDGAYIGDLDNLKVELAAISQLLTDVANNAKPYAKGLTSTKNAELLVNLAKQGSWLYRKLVRDYIDRSPAAKVLKDSEYLQIVSTKPDALVPLEFVYEYPPPAEHAPVCKNAKDALTSGVCPATCIPSGSPAPHVCPLGFWGLRKVIERHIHVPGPGGGAKVGSEPVAGRDVLSLEGTTLLAISEQVPKPASTKLGQGVTAAWKAGVVPVTKWTEWKDAIKQDNPILLLALPHSGGAGQKMTLEIGGDVLETTYIDDTYVRVDKTRTPPIAVLLGCDTSAVSDPAAYASHVEAFRGADAALVLGTVATVLGASAAPMAARLVDYLADSANTHAGRFGEILRSAKRQAVADSEMIALCLVAFGDADWKLQ
jgi:hypothetical protein